MSSLLRVVLAGLVVGLVACGGALAQDYTPAFRVVEHTDPWHDVVDSKVVECTGERFVWVYDGEQKIALLDKKQCWLQILRTRPNTGKPVDHPMPLIYHYPTLEGTNLSVALYPEMFFPKSERRTWKEEVIDGRVVISLKEEYDRRDGEGTHTTTVYYDAPTGRYEVLREVDTTLAEAGNWEYCNFYPGGGGESRPEHKRFTTTAWRHPNGTVYAHRHNPMVGTTAGLPREIATGGWIAWLGEDDDNPIMDILASDPPTYSSTCNAWYDEHVSVYWPRARLRKGGPYRARVKARVRFVARAEADAMIEDATWSRGRGGYMPAFVQGVVNDVEEPMELGDLVVGAQWGFRRGSSWDRKVGRSGTSSLRLQGRRENSRVSLAPGGGGAIPHLDDQARYRWSAWVKTEGDVAVYLRFRKIYVNPARTDPTGDSERVKGAEDWTQLVLEFDTADHAPFVTPYLCLEGKGTAWFDDIELKCLGPIEGD